MTDIGQSMRSSRTLYDLLAPDYDEHFAVPLRRAYDELAWDICSAAIPPPPAVVVDVGCGNGRWAQRLLATGHHVVGIEPAPRMAAEAANRLRRWVPSEFCLLNAPVEDVELEPGTVDVVLAIGSLQYTGDPAATLRQLARWLRHGGRLCVLVDSLHALVIELLRADRPAEARQRHETRLGQWRVGGAEADLHLLDQAALRAGMADAGLDVVHVAGLLVGASTRGRAELTRRLERNYESALAAERDLAAEPAFADLGKQLLMIGRRPVPAP